jgi:hypothetical protein
MSSALTSSSTAEKNLFALARGIGIDGIEVDRCLDNIAKDLRAAISIRQRTAQERFDSLLLRWQEETLLVSSFTERLAHPAYLAITAMGEAALPFIFSEFRHARFDHWGPALEAITGVRLDVPESERGNMRALGRRWLAWASQRGY